MDSKKILKYQIFSAIFAIILGEFISYKRIVSKKTCMNSFAIVILIILLFAFVKFTYSPPRIQLFQDPITGEYGRDTYIT